MADSLRPDQSLFSASNDMLVSNNGQYRLVMQSDGNLVLYDQNNSALWATGTDGQNVELCVMQGDGNLVLYLRASRRPVWASNTDGNPGSFLAVQDDGNAVIYKPNQPIWATGTNR